MSLPTEKRNIARWLGQFALYLALFALLVAAAVYWFSRDAPATPSAPAPPKRDAPAGLSGHEAPRQSPSPIE